MMANKTNFVSEESCRELAVASRILAARQVVDGYGHVSVRCAGGFLLSRSLAPELVKTEDIILYDVNTSEPVDAAETRVSTVERFIHGEIYKARPDVQAVVHSHAQSVVPFTCVDVGLKPCFHMAAFVGLGCPCFDIRDKRTRSDLLIRDQQLGLELARTLGKHPSCLLRNHGCVVTGASLPHAVGRAVYFEANAR